MLSISIKTIPRSDENNDALVLSQMFELKFNHSFAIRTLSNGIIAPFDTSSPQ